MHRSRDRRRKEGWREGGRKGGKERENITERRREDSVLSENIFEIDKLFLIKKAESILPSDYLI